MYSKRKWLIVTCIAFIFSTVTAHFTLKEVSGANMWVYVSAIPDPIRAAGDTFLKGIYNLPYLHYKIFKSHELPKYDLVIDQKDLHFLNSNLPEPGGLLSSEHKKYVKANIIYNDKVYPVKVRYRGTLQNHWLWPKKSFRLKFTSFFLEGKKNLNLIVPRDRGFFIEELNFYRAKKLGLKVPDSRFVVLTINGKNSRVYWETEQLSKEMLERNELNGYSNLYASEDLVGTIYDDIIYWKKQSENTASQENNMTDMVILLDLLNYSSDDYFYKHIFSILDKESFYQWSVHNALAFGTHQNWTHNANIYFDTSLGKFLLIPWDTHMGEPPEYYNSDIAIEKSSHVLENRILKLPTFMEERNRRIWEYVKDDIQISDDLMYFDSLYKKTRVAFYQDSIKESVNGSFDESIVNTRQSLLSNFLFWRELFVDTTITLDVIQDNSGWIVDMSTRSLSPIVIERIELLSESSGTFFIYDINKEPFCSSVFQNSNVNVKTVANCDPEERLLYPQVRIQQESSLPEEYVFDLDAYKTFVLENTKTRMFITYSGEDKYSTQHNLRIVLRNVYTNNIDDYVFAL